MTSDPAAAVAALGAAAAVAFVLVHLVDGATRPGYDPVRQPVSALALGRRGWVQTTSFILCGALIAAGGVAATTVAWLAGAGIAVVGVGLVASGAFRMDPMRGYPPGTPDTTPQTYSWRHRWHDHAGAVVFFGFPASAALAAIGPGLPLELRIVSAGAALATVALADRFSSAWERDAPDAGRWQRLTIAVAMGWFALVLGYVGFSGPA